MDESTRQRMAERIHILECIHRANGQWPDLLDLFLASPDRPAATRQLIELGYTEVQAGHLLSCQFAKLTQLSRAEVEEELNELRNLAAQ